MTTTPQRAFEDSTKGAFAYGMTIFAAAMLVTIGLFQCVAGLAALFDDEFFVTTENYTFKFDITMWGWTYLAIGLLAPLRRPGRRSQPGGAPDKTGTGAHGGE